MELNLDNFERASYLQKTVAELAATFERNAELDLIMPLRNVQKLTIADDSDQRSYVNINDINNDQSDHTDSKVMIKPVRLKKKQNAQWNRTSDSKLLLSASKEGNLDIVKWLVKHGASLKIRDDKGRTPLLIAAIAKKMCVFKYLLQECSADEVDENGWNVLHIGAILGHLKIVQEVRNIVDINSRSRSGISSICLAVNKGNMEVVEYLLREGADVTIPSYQGWNALHFASRGRHYSILYILINSGKCDKMLNSRTSEGLTPLILAVAQGDLNCVKLILDSGADANIRDNKGWTAAKIAVIYNYREIIDYLATYKAVM